MPVWWARPSGPAACGVTQQGTYRLAPLSPSVVLNLLAPSQVSPGPWEGQGLKWALLSPASCHVYFR